MNRAQRREAIDEAIDELEREREPDFLQSAALLEIEEIEQRASVMVENLDTAPARRRHEPCTIKKSGQRG